jgi:hypothetical protein
MGSTSESLDHLCFCGPGRARLIYVADERNLSVCVREVLDHRRPTL